MTKFSSENIKILVVDDHPIVRDGLKLLLNREKDIEVCGLAENAEKGLKEINNLSPNIVIVDISLKGTINGLELTRAISQRYPEIPVLVLSMHDENLYAERAVRAGARGYIMKHEMTDVIVDAIRRISNKGFYFSEKMSDFLFTKMMFMKKNISSNPIDDLTDRELEVFLLIGEGLSTKEISKKLNLKTKTIDTYRLRIKEKLVVETKTELTKLAFEWKHNIGNKNNPS